MIIPAGSLRPAAADRRWQLAVAALASITLSSPLILMGTPDVESYVLSAFSTMAFARNLVAGVDPWFAPDYGFGIALPSSSWLIKFPLAIPAALAGVDWLYATIWLGGEFVFAFYFLRLAMAFTHRRGVAVVLLITALLSFSNLGTTYVNDWPEAFLGWAFLPACLWFVGRTLVTDSRQERLKAAAACAFVLGIFTGVTHHNEMVTFFSGLAVMLVFLLPLRSSGVLAVAGAVVVALCSTADVLVPAVQGMLAGGANPILGSVASGGDALRLPSYGSFLEPFRGYVAGGLPATTVSLYQRVPFFGLAALLLAIVGVARPFASRAAIGSVPNDLARAIAVGFVLYSALTLLPSWVALNLPRMWTYRDGQTVLGLLCAAMALDGLWPRLGRLLPAILGLHLLQMWIVAAPIVSEVLQEDDARLFGYAREERVLFDHLRRFGVDRHSRLMLAGQLEEIVRGSLGPAGVTADTDFALERIPVVNAWYRGAATPQLGEASMDGRYGTYETIISWKTNLHYLESSGLDVLGITHIAVLDEDLEQLTLTDDLVPAGTFALPGGRRVHLLHNDDAWSRVVLLLPGEIDSPVPRPSCPSATIYCRSFTSLSKQLQARIESDWQGSSMTAMLPPDHAGGTVVVSVAAGPRPAALVDGERRPVNFLLGQFATFDVKPGERSIALSVRRTDRVTLSAIGLALLVGCFAVAILPWRRSSPDQERV